MSPNGRDVKRYAVTRSRLDRIRDLEEAERTCKAANESQRTTIAALEADRDFWKKLADGHADTLGELRAELAEKETHRHVWLGLRCKCGVSSDESIRALEAERDEFRELYEACERNHGIQFDRLVEEKRPLKARVESAEAALRANIETQDALHARVAELEVAAHERAPMTQDSMGSSLSHEEYHGWYGEPCECRARDRDDVREGEG